MDKLYACAVLIDNMIWAWKVSYTPWNSWHDATMRLPIPDGKVELKTRMFPVVMHTLDTDDEVKPLDIFEKSAPEWFSQWEIHPEFKGNMPYRKVELCKRMPDGLLYKYLEVRS